MKSFTLKFNHVHELPITDSLENPDFSIGRLVGYLSPPMFLDMILQLSESNNHLLDANPRLAKESRITKSIVGALETTPKSFHLMTKGLLLAFNSCEVLERNRVKIGCSFDPADRNGILDGGHNTYAIWKHLLSISGLVTDSDFRRVRNIDDLLKAYSESREKIVTLLKNHYEEDASSSFVVPVDILFPIPVHEGKPVYSDKWSLEINEITAARNNNAQLQMVSIEEYQNSFEDLKQALQGSPLFDRIVWKEGDNGDIFVRDIAALSLILLNACFPKEVGSLTKIYSSKESCLKTFVSIKKIQNKEESFKECLKLLPSLLEAYDHTYLRFPEAYNRAKGSFGRISSVKQKKAHTKFFNAETEYEYPDGFIMPIIAALSELIQRDQNGKVSFIEEPKEFLNKNLSDLTLSLKDYIDAFKWNAQTLGKAAGAYNTMSSMVKTKADNLR
jgi:hypothetical protein